MVKDTKLQALSSAIWLATQKTQKKIVLSYYPMASRFINEHYPLAKGDERHREGNFWVRSDLAYTADRAYRLFLELFPGEAIVSKPLTVIDFARYSQLYFNTYPNDDMSTNRLHFFIQSIRDGEVVRMKKCKCCDKPYVVHRNDCQIQICGICRRKEAIKAEMEISLAASKLAVGA